jgi:circadian clock protein KaiB
MNRPENKEGESESGSQEKWILRLFVAGATPNSNSAIKNLKAILEDFLPNQYQLDILDVLEEPLEALKENVLVAPTLIKSSPPPEVRIIGNMSERDKVLWQLRLSEKRK